MEQKYIIDDWVRVNNKKALVIETYQDADFSIIYLINDEEYKANEIQGIPLTTEILEKNGWKLIHGFYCSPNEEGAEINLVSQTGYAWKAYTNHYLLHPKINSVSDLQHLLFGLGLDSCLKV